MAVVLGFDPELLKINSHYSSCHELRLFPKCFLLPDWFLIYNGWNRESKEKGKIEDIGCFCWASGQPEPTPRRPTSSRFSLALPKFQFWYRATPEAQSGGDEYSISRERKTEISKRKEKKINLNLPSHTNNWSVYYELAFFFSHRDVGPRSHAWSLIHRGGCVCSVKPVFVGVVWETRKKKVATCFYVSNLTDRCVTERWWPLKKENKKKLSRWCRDVPSRNWNSCSSRYF